MLRVVKAGPKQFRIEGDLDKAAKILMVSKAELLSYPAFYEGKTIGETILFEKNADAITFVGLVQSQVKLNREFKINF